MQFDSLFIIKYTEIVPLSAFNPLVPPILGEIKSIGDTPNTPVLPRKDTSFETTAFVIHPIETYSSIGRSLNGFTVTPDSMPGKGATASESRNLPFVIQSLSVFAISSALG